MDFFVYSWLYDKRWFFSFTPPSPYKLWLVPFVFNLFFVFYNSYLLYYSALGFCFDNYRFWLQARNVLLMLSEFLIAYMIVLSIKHKKKQRAKFINLSYKEALLNRFEFWVRKKGLRSVTGLTTLAVSLVNVTWGFVGLHMMKAHDYNVCDLDSNGIIVLQIICTLLCVIPFIFTFIAFWLIKGSSILVGWLCPDALIWLKKR